jgi:hypothetical protein
MKSTDWKTQLFGKGLGLLVDPFAEQAAAEAEGRRMDRERKDKEKAAASADAAEEAASGSMTEAEFNTWLKGWKEQEKAADDFRKKLEEVTQQAANFGDAQATARQKAIDAGAADEAQIQQFVDQLDRLDTAKRERKDADDALREFERSLDEQEKLREKFRRDTMTKEEKAAEELQAAQDAGLQGPDLDKLRDKLARELVPKTADQVVSGANKGSQEAFAAIARSGRVSQQEKYLKDIRDALQKQLKQEPIMVTEIVA